MGTRTKILGMLALAGTFTALALPGTPSAGAASAARSGVTIHLFIGDAVKGYVFSPKLGECAEGRAVRVFRQKGKRVNPRRDIKVAKTRATQSANGGYRWEVGLDRPRPGHYYARVRATAACQADNSRTVTITARPQTKIVDTSLYPDTRSASFEWRAVDGVQPYKFRCKLDDQPYRRCREFGKEYSHLSRGHHVFKVFAIGGNGKQDITPARRGFDFTR
jgi:hypothetical protein